MNEATQPLVNKARRFLRSAAVLRGEGDFDSAASRLYYAMFYLAEAALSSKGVAFKSHRAVLAGFNQHLVHTGDLPQEHYRRLSQAFDARQLADYAPTSLLRELELQELESKAAAFVD